MLNHIVFSVCMSLVACFDQCLACKADLDISNVTDPLPCPTEVNRASVFPKQSSSQINDPCPPAVSQPLSLIKASFLPLTQKCVRHRCESDFSRDCTGLISFDGAAAISRSDLSDSPLSQGDLTISSHNPLKT